MTEDKVSEAIFAVTLCAVSCAFGFRWAKEEDRLATGPHINGLGTDYLNVIPRSRFSSVIRSSSSMK